MAAAAKACSIPEIFETILDSIDSRNDVLNCAQVNSTWYGQSVARLWQGSVWEHGWKTPSLGWLSRLHETTHNQADIEKYIQKIKFLHLYTKREVEPLEKITQSFVNFLALAKPEFLCLCLPDENEYPPFYTLIQPLLHRNLLVLDLGWLRDEPVLKAVQTQCPNLRGLGYYNLGIYEKQQLRELIRNMPSITHFRCFMMYVTNGYIISDIIQRPNLIWWEEEAIVLNRGAMLQRLVGDMESTQSPAFTQLQGFLLCSCPYDLIDSFLHLLTRCRKLAAFRFRPNEDREASAPFENNSKYTNPFSPILEANFQLRYLELGFVEALRPAIPHLLASLERRPTLQHLDLYRIWPTYARRDEFVVDQKILKISGKPMVDLANCLPNIEFLKIDIPNDFGVEDLLNFSKDRCPRLHTLMMDSLVEIHNLVDVLRRIETSTCSFSSSDNGDDDGLDPRVVWPRLQMFEFHCFTKFEATRPLLRSEDLNDLENVWTHSDQLPITKEDWLNQTFSCLSKHMPSLCSSVWLFAFRVGRDPKFPSAHELMLKHLHNQLESMLLERHGMSAHSECRTYNAGDRLLTEIYTQSLFGNHAI